MRLNGIIAGLVGVLLAAGLQSSAAGAASPDPVDQRGDGGGAAQSEGVTIRGGCGDGVRVELSALPSRRAGHLLVRVRASGLESGELSRGWVTTGSPGPRDDDYDDAELVRRADAEGEWTYQTVLRAAKDGTVSAGWYSGRQIDCSASQKLTYPMYGSTFGQSRHAGFFAINRTDRPGRYRIRFLADAGDTTDRWLMSISRSGGSSAGGSVSEEPPGRQGVIRTEAVFRLHGDTTLKFAAIGPDDQRVRLQLRRTWP